MPSDTRDPAGRVKLYRALERVFDVDPDSPVGEVLRMLVRREQQRLVIEMTQDEKVYLCEDH